jgi:primosomal protein N'
MKSTTARTSRTSCLATTPGMWRSSGAQITGAQVILGSATPSLESWKNATGDAARYALCELTRRVGAARLPEVRVVDLGEAGTPVCGRAGADHGLAH